METNIFVTVFPINFIRLLLQATGNIPLKNYGLRRFNPSSLQDDFCYLQQPSVPNRWVSWSPGTFAPWWKNQPTCRAANCWPRMGTHLSGGKKPGTAKKSPLFGGCCALDPWMLCRDQHRWQQPLQLQLNPHERAPVETINLLIIICHRSLSWYEMPEIYTTLGSGWENNDALIVHAS